MNISNTNGLHVDKCSICSSLKIAPKYTTTDMHYGGGLPDFDVWECGDCRLLFLNPMPTEEELHSYYPDSTGYYAYSEVNMQTAQRPKGLIPFLKRLVINYTTHDPTFDNVKNRSMVDVGCGSGAQLIEFTQKGWGRVVGVEIDAEACAIGTKKGLEIHQGTLHDAAFPDNSFDYVRSNHTLEHIIQNEAVINEMFRICKPGGKMFIGVPNTDSLAFRLFGMHWFYLTIPFHAYNYNPKNLKMLVSKAGFQPKAVYFNGNALGLIGSLQLKINDRRQIPNPHGFFNNRFFELLAYQLARIANWFHYGDIMELVSEKPNTP